MKLSAFVDIPVQVANGTSPVIVRPEDPVFSALQSIIIPIIVSSITAFFLWYQIRKQTKVDSAKFTMDFFDKIQANNISTIHHIRDRHKGDSTKPYDAQQIRMLLNQFEYMSKFWEDGLIKLNHITNMFGKTLRNIKNDEEINNIIILEQKYNKHAYTEIEKLLKQIKD